MLAYIGNFEPPESLGAFGFAWQEIMAKNIGFPVLAINASRYGKVVDGMYKVYLKYKPFNYVRPSLIRAISKETGQSPDIVSKFLDEMVKKETTGKVLPVKAEQDKVVNPLNYIKPLLIVAGIGVSAYLLSQLNKIKGVL